MEKALESGGKPRATRNLCNLDDLRSRGGKPVGELRDPKRPAHHNHHRRQHRLRDVGAGIVSARSCRRWHRNSKLAPESQPIEFQTLERAPEHPVEKNDLSGRRDDDASGADRSVGEAGGGVEGGEGGQDLQQKPERGVDAGRGGFVKVGQSPSRTSESRLPGTNSDTMTTPPLRGSRSRLRGCANARPRTPRPVPAAARIALSNAPNSGRRWRRSRMPPVSRSNMRVRSPRPSSNPDVERDAGM